MLFSQDRARCVRRVARAASLSLLFALLLACACSVRFAVGDDGDYSDVDADALELEPEEEWYGQQDGPPHASGEAGGSGTSPLDAIVLWILLNPNEVSKQQELARRIQLLLRQPWCGPSAFVRRC